ncbi:HDIG domain-containing protein [Alkalibaculum sp. M08DMB]|uniref:HDIG domain-containing protein n=1 Tax=Alkalibaculum sporogenes TaxID=2655001 RepID=A0A6A7K9E8_9FIRM|nr:HDIG domain-containing metalloprotein [Alkalibaculum sporogenes]MPW26070.1 HDIG domain-containing protein [Alkalibaculum sporogenes]
MILKNDLFDEIDQHLQKDIYPSKFLNDLSNRNLLIEYPFDVLEKLKQTKQSPKYHPEGSVWNHTMLVVDAAAGQREHSKNQRIFMWAALLHDIGKPSTTAKRKGKITSYDHDIVGAKMTREFLMEFVNDNDFISQVTSLVRWHMQILFVVNNLPFADIDAMKQEVDLSEIALLGFCDRLGRLNVDYGKEQDNINIFIEKMNK